MIANLLLAAAYAGDENFIKQYLRQYFYNYITSMPGAGMPQWWIEYALMIEDIALINSLCQFQPDFLANTSAFNQFRIKQFHNDLSAYCDLANSLQDVSFFFDSLNHSTQAINLCDLGGLGDYIENIALLISLSACLPNTCFQVRVPAGLACFLTQTINHSSIKFIDVSWSDRYMQSTSHLLTVAAIARNRYMLEPYSPAQCIDPDGMIFDINYLDSLSIREISDGAPFAVVLTQSQKKISNISMKNSYFRRSFDRINNFSLINDLLADHVVIDIADYYNNEDASFKGRKNYYNIPSASLGYLRLAALMIHARSIHTIDSFQAHLAAFLGVPYMLYLPVGHDQRWFVNLSPSSNSMYAKSARVFKQKKLHDWSTCARLASLEMHTL